MIRPLSVFVLASLLAASIAAEQQLASQPSAQPQGRGQGRGPAPGDGRRGQPPRDVTTPAGTAAVSGKVVAADTGRALRHARVVVSGDGRPHATSTDEQGRYRVTSLSAGTYSISAAKSGFVDGAYGQRRASG